MAERTILVSERDRWVINTVAYGIKPANFEETRKLNRIWDAFDIEGFTKQAEGRTLDQLDTTPVETKCEEAAYNYLLTQLEPTLGRLNPAMPAKMIASELLALHERLTKDEKK